MKYLVILNIALITLFSCRNPKQEYRPMYPDTPKECPQNIEKEEPMLVSFRDVKAVPYWDTNSDTVFLKTRGIRNNNPSNIKRGADWVGLDTMHTDSTYRQFVSMEYGVRALIKVLLNYDNKGINTPKKIIERFASGRASYISYISIQTDTGIAERFDFDNRDKFYLLCKSICQFESGYYLDRSTFNEAYSMIEL